MTKGRIDIGSLSRNGAGRHFRETYEFATPRHLCNASVRETYVQGPAKYPREGSGRFKELPSLGPFKEMA